MTTTTIKTAAGEPQRLDAALAEAFEISRGRARRWLAAGLVTLNGRPVADRDKGRIVAPGDDLQLTTDPAQVEQPAANPELADRLADRIVGGSVDGPWIAIDKPSGLGVHPLNPDQTDTLLNALVVLAPRVVGVGPGGLRSGVVHRLDVGTSGVVVFALEQAVFEKLRVGFNRRSVSKLYHAVVRLPQDSNAHAESAGPLPVRGQWQRLELPLYVARHRPARVAVATPAVQRERPADIRLCDLCYRIVDPASLNATPPANGVGGPAETRNDGLARVTAPLPEAFSAMAAEPGMAMVEVDLGTGFLHQIRVMLAHLGTPVVGDADYGGEASQPQHAGPADRLMLHASALTLPPGI